jgi:hypothetical protein
VVAVNRNPNRKGGALKEPTIRFPVTCPQCGNEFLTQMPVAVIAIGLIRGQNIRLFSDCHGVWWDASSLELEQIREYLGTSWLDAQRG